ncbi:MAG: hypothetical protein K9J30_06710 [Bacteroidales bacterium]|nr:hypothetical protein [Bacteroidales bacterium]
MKRFLILIIVTLFALIRVYAHPIHVSVTNISFSDDSMFIRINTFVDDWETAYFHYHGEFTDLKTVNVFNNKWFNSYFRSSFKIEINSENVELSANPVTVNFDELAMTIKMRVKLNEKPKTLYLYNALLTDIFTDQTNLLIYSGTKKEKGIKFDARHKEELLKL